MRNRDCLNHSLSSYSFRSVLTIDPKMEEAANLYEFGTGFPKPPSLAKPSIHKGTSHHRVERLLSPYRSESGRSDGLLHGRIHPRHAARSGAERYWLQRGVRCRDYHTLLTC